MMQGGRSRGSCRLAARSRRASSYLQTSSCSSVTTFCRTSSRASTMQRIWSPAVESVNNGTALTEMINIGNVYTNVIGMCGISVTILKVSGTPRKETPDVE
jgi:hypothetical protein